MKITVDESMFIQRFRDYGRMDQFSISGLRALFEYLEELDESTGEETELDVVSLCCDFSEFETAAQAAEEYGWTKDEEADDDANNEAALDWLRDRTQVVEHDDGVIIAGF